MRAITEDRIEKANRLGLLGATPAEQAKQLGVPIGTLRATMSRHDPPLYWDPFQRQWTIKRRLSTGPVAGLPFRARGKRKAVAR